MIASILNFVLASLHNPTIAQPFGYVVGSITIFATAMLTISSEMRSTEKAELHRVKGKQFSKFVRKIMLELSLRPSDRRECSEFSKSCVDDMDRPTKNENSIIRLL
jgi:hypothetical protein